MKAKHVMELTRANHGLIVAFAILAGQVIALNALPDMLTFVLSALCGIMIQAGSFAIGDFFDIKADVANKRFDRPLARGDMKPKAAVNIAFAAFLAGFVFAYFLNTNAFYIAVLFAIIGAAYGYYFKNVALVGNIFTASSMAIPFIFGAYTVSSSAPLAVWVIAMIAFLAGTGRELIKGVQDMKGDEAAGRKTFAIITGKYNTLFFAKAFIFLALLASAIPFFYISEYYMDFVFLILMSINSFVWVKIIWEGEKKAELDRARMDTLYGMLLGTLAFLLGALF